jgi:hypothetical protein
LQPTTDGRSRQERSRATRVESKRTSRLDNFW